MSITGSAPSSMVTGIWTPLPRGIIVRLLVCVAVASRVPWALVCSSRSVESRSNCALSASCLELLASMRREIRLASSGSMGVCCRASILNDGGIRYKDGLLWGGLKHPCGLNQVPSTDRHGQGV